MKSRQLFVTGSLASALLISAAAYAQQPRSDQQQTQNQSQQLSNRDVRQYMQRVERDINQMMQSGNLSRLRQWTQNNIADNAVFSGNRQLNGRGMTNAFISFTATKPDLMRLQRFALSSMPDLANVVQNYDLNIRVLNVEPVGDSAAIVRTRISETRSLNFQGAAAQSQQSQQSRQSQQQSSTIGQRQYNEDADESEGGGQQRFQQNDQQRGRSFSRGQGGGVDIETQAMCTHLVQRNSDDNHLQIAMGICDAQSSAPF